MNPFPAASVKNLKALPPFLVICAGRFDVSPEDRAFHSSAACSAKRPLPHGFLERASKGRGYWINDPGFGLS